MKLNSNLIFKANDQYFTLSKFWDNVVKERKVTDSRARGNVIYRHAFSSICYDVSTLPIVQIASIIKRDHATVIHAVRVNEENRKYDPRYESVYVWMHNEISKALKDHIDERSALVMARVRKTNPDIDIDSLVEGINREWNLKTSITIEENKKLKKEHEGIIKQLQFLTARNKLLESELKRVKNLL